MCQLTSGGGGEGLYQPLKQGSPLLSLPGVRGEEEGDGQFHQETRQAGPAGQLPGLPGQELPGVDTWGAVKAIEFNQI